MKNNKGITLIALVITIIVLLILAGVSIAMLTGNNGILSQSQNAVNDTERAEVVERINMELQAAYAEALSSDTVLDFSKELTQINANLNGKATATAATTSILRIEGAGEYSSIYGIVTSAGKDSEIDLAE